MERFIELWTSSEYPPETVSELEVASAEEKLGTIFPASYRSAIINHGLPLPTIALLDKVVDLELDIADVSEFLTPSDMVERTFDWHELGLAVDMIAFAADSSGNLFCFPESSKSLKSGESPIIFFDHDFETIETVSASFPEWLDTYCKLAVQ